MKQKLYIIGLILSLIFILSNCTNNYEEGIKSFDEKNYDQALTSFKEVNETDKNFDLAQIKIREIDSIKTQIRIEKERQDSIEKVERRKKEAEELKDKVIREIEGIKTFNGSAYRDDVSSLQIEIALFATWAKIIGEADYSLDKEINNLGKTLKSKVIALQKTEFPKMRKNYGEILKKKLWSEDISVSTKGTGHTTLEFIGGIFASNQNKQDFQETLNEILSQLRFKRVNYKWYKYDDEYTYYSIKTEQDGELVEL